MNSIQEERMKGYFLNAAKELIRGEGLEVVSTRNVAERAGYSYATLYNYFKDIRDLIFSCVEDFMGECREFVQKETANGQSGEKALMALSTSYAKFFIQYPGIFDLLFQEKANQISTSASKLESVSRLFNSLVEKEWETIGKKRKRSEKDISHAMEMHTLALHGLLMLYINKRVSDDCRALMEKIHELTQGSVATL